LNKIIALLTLLIFSGCTLKPINYDLSTQNRLPPIKSNNNIPYISIYNFQYEPSIGISQNSMSLNCLTCDSNGSTPSFIFDIPIKEIVQAEISSAFKESMIPSANPLCELSATIHLASWNNINGDSTVDLTYTLSKDKQIKFIKRITGYYNSSIFELQRTNKILAKASRDSAEKLINNKLFLESIDNNCR
jgi:hypothetical protein